MLTLLLVAAAAAPSPQSLALGKRLAAAGTLSTVVTLMTRKETEEMVAAHPELSAAEQGKLRSIAGETARTAQGRLTDAIGAGYAAQLTLPELKTLVAFYESPTAKRQRAVMPQVLTEALPRLDKFDFKGETMAGFCKATGKLCAPAK